jgi:hypothetical protein
MGDNLAVLGRYLSAFSGSAAFHAALILLLLWPARASVTAPHTRARPERAVQVFAVPQEDATFPGLKPVDPATAAQIQPLDEASASVSIGNFTFDASKLVALASVLFPFVSPGVSLDHFAIRPGEVRALVYERPASASVDHHGPDARSLEMSERAIQALIDKTWSRRERWDAFQPIVKLARTSNADSGALPLMFQRYTDQNALQPYQDMAIRDPRLWAQLGIAADHVRFIGFIREYVAAHPHTRGAIEVLFLLDRIAEASEDALQTLLACNPEEDLRWTRESNRRAYRLALQLRAHYQAELSRSGIASRAALAKHYANVRLAILEGILRTTPNGYRVGDARFLIGAIHWRQGREAEALRAWRGMAVTPADSYPAASEQLLSALRAEDVNRDSAPLSRQVNRILRYEVGRWVDFSYDRLKHFGYAFDTY